MKLISLLIPKKSKAEIEESVVPSIEYEQERYPYGSSLSFNKEEITKLAVLKDINPNAQVNITAKGFVKEIAVNDTTKGRNSHRVEIQITDINITTTPKRREDMTPAEYRKDRGL